jgi:hypothetical protein
MGRYSANRIQNDLEVHTNSAEQKIFERILKTMKIAWEHPASNLIENIFTRNASYQEDPFRRKIQGLQHSELLDSSP